MAIYNEAVLNTTATYDYEPQTLEQRAAWLQEHQRDNYPVFVAVDDQAQVLGWSALSQYRNRFGYRFTVENSVYVAPAQRGRGLGRLLLPPLIEAARARGLHAILATIDAENQVSIRLHAAFGFESVGLLRQVGFKFGRWLDVLFMERIVEGMAPPGRSLAGGACVGGSAGYGSPSPWGKSRGEGEQAGEESGGRHKP